MLICTIVYVALLLFKKHAVDIVDFHSHLYLHSPTGFVKLTQTPTFRRRLCIGPTLVYLRNFIRGITLSVCQKFKL